MNILEEIELRLYRFAQEGYCRSDYAKRAKNLAIEILNLTTENHNKIMEEKGAR